MSEEMIDHSGASARPDQDHGEVLRVLVVDDEYFGRKRVLDLLDGEEGIAIVGSVESGRAAIESIRTVGPDVVFLDVQMPDCSGLDVVREVGAEVMPVTVFVTAYDRHAIAAFELAALDYLLKPFEDERFRQALSRARRAVRLRHLGELDPGIIRLLGDGRSTGTTEAAGERPTYLERITVEKRGQRRFIPVERIDYLTADGPYAEIHAGPDTYIIRARMATLEQRLDPAHFFRIHRSAIVRLDRVVSLLIGAGGDYAARLIDGTELRVARTRRDELAARISPAAPP